MSPRPQATIREFQEADRQTRRTLYLRSRRQAFTWLDQSRFRLEDVDTDCDGERIWVAERLEDIVGFVSVWSPSHFIHNLFIDPFHQRTGIGRALLNAALEQIDRPGTLKCDATDSHALAFYASQCWTRIKREIGPNGPYFLLEYSQRAPRSDSQQSDRSEFTGLKSTPSATPPTQSPRSTSSVGSAIFRLSPRRHPLARL